MGSSLRPAQPALTQCDTAAGDIWFHGIKLGERAAIRTALRTGGKGTYCTTQQADNATYMALPRVAISGLVGLNRVAVLRTASNFDRPYLGTDSLALSVRLRSRGRFGRLRTRREQSLGGLRSLHQECRRPLGQQVEARGAQVRTRTTQGAGRSFISI
jgi:hypothetical protein